VFASAPCCHDPILLQRERAVLSVDHHQAAAWLLRKWHVPRRMLVPAQHHHEPDYRGAEWRTSLLVGFCARWLQQDCGEIHEVDRIADTMTVLGLPASVIDKARHACEEQRERLQELAELLSRREPPA
jgi:HD-like signal output (HDOD) protein